MAVARDNAGVHFPPPLVYLGALLMGFGAERFLALRSFGVDWRWLAATGAPLFIAGAALMFTAAGLFRRVGTKVPPSRPTTRIATTSVFGHGACLRGPCNGLRRARRARLLPLVLIVIETQVIVRQERYLGAKFGEDYRRYKAAVYC